MYSTKKVETLKKSELAIDGSAKLSVLKERFLSLCLNSSYKLCFLARVFGFSVLA